MTGRNVDCCPALVSCLLKFKFEERLESIIYSLKIKLNVLEECLGMNVYWGKCRRKNASIAMVGPPSRDTT